MKLKHLIKEIINMFDYFRPNPKPKSKGKKIKKPLPKRSKKYKAATAKEKIWMATIKQMQCCVCGAAPVEVHHITTGGRRLGHLYTIPLCHEHHEGKFSIGNAKKSFVEKYGTELQLLEKVKSLVIKKLF